MAREDEYTTKAQRNETFAASLDKADATQEVWAVTAVFYSALHYVQAYFVKHGAADECDNHTKRYEQIKKDPKLRYIATEYKFLYSLSRTARYYCSGLPQKPYQEAVNRLMAVKRQVAHAMAN